MKIVAFAFAMAFCARCIAQSGDALSPEVCQVFAKDRVMDSNQYLSTDFNLEKQYEATCRGTQTDIDTRLNLASKMSTISDYVPIKDVKSLDFAHKKSYMDRYCKSLEMMSLSERKRAGASREFSDNMRDTTQACLNVVKEAVLQQGKVFAVATPDNSTLTEFLVSLSARPIPRKNVALVGYDGGGVQGDWNSTCSPSHEWSVF